MEKWEVDKITRRIKKAERRIAAGKNVAEETARVARLFSVLFAEGAING